jgi:hypothetical protein
MNPTVADDMAVNLFGFKQPMMRLEQKDNRCLDVTQVG